MQRKSNHIDVNMAKNYKKQWTSKTAFIIYKTDRFINHFNLMFIHGKLRSFHDRLRFIHLMIVTLIHRRYLQGVS